jgi:hypothetical protein
MPGLWGCRRCSRSSPMSGHRSRLVLQFPLKSVDNVFELPSAVRLRPKLMQLETTHRLDTRLNYDDTVEGPAKVKEVVHTSLAPTAGTTFAVGRVKDGMCRLQALLLYCASCEHCYCSCCSCCCYLLLSAATICCCRRKHSRTPPTPTSASTGTMHIVPVSSVLHMRPTFRHLDPPPSATDSSVGAGAGAGAGAGEGLVDEDGTPVVRIQTQILRRVNRRAPVSTTSSADNGSRFSSRAEYEAAKRDDPMVELEVTVHGAGDLFDGCLAAE